MKILPCGVAVIEGDTTHARWIEELGTIHHDPWMRDRVLEHVKPGELVIQGGANIGTLTVPILERCGIVHAFEPNPEAQECLLHNCRMVKRGDGLHHVITIHRSGLSDFCGLVPFLRESNAGASHFGEGEESISVLTIDSEHLDPSLILLDIEGYEVKAIRGGRETIARCHPTIICEVNRGALERAGTNEAELLGLIEDMGYSIQVLQPDCHIGDPQYDILCLPR